MRLNEKLTLWSVKRLILLPGFLDKQIYFVQTNSKFVGTMTLCFYLLCVRSSYCSTTFTPPSALIQNNLAGDFTD